LGVKISLITAILLIAVLISSKFIKLNVKK